MIDQALHLFGLLDSVLGDVFAQRENGVVDDYFHIILGYGKLRVILHSSCLVKKSGPRFQVHGSKGSYIKYGLDSQEDALKAGKVPGDPEWGKEEEHLYGELSIESAELNLLSKVETIPGSHEAFYEALYHSIIDQKPVPVEAVDAMNTIRVIKAVKRSSLEQRTISFK